jgi:hypothetical protein
MPQVTLDVPDGWLPQQAARALASYCRKRKTNEAPDMDEPSDDTDNLLAFQICRRPDAALRFFSRKSCSLFLIALADDLLVRFPGDLIIFCKSSPLFLIVLANNLLVRAIDRKKGLTT